MYVQLSSRKTFTNKIMTKLILFYAESCQLQQFFVLCFCEKNFALYRCMLVFACRIILLFFKDLFVHCVIVESTLDARVGVAKDLNVLEGDHFTTDRQMFFAKVGALGLFDNPWKWHQQTVIIAYDKLMATKGQCKSETAAKMLQQQMKFLLVCSCSYFS